MIDVRCDQGLGNRVAAIANGLSRSRRIRFAWRNNPHCPIDLERIFPAGIEGVEFDQADASGPMTWWDGHAANSWHAAGDRARANEAFTEIMEAMAGVAVAGPQLAVCGRFHRNEDASVRALVETLCHAARERGLHEAYVFSDRHRKLMATLMSDQGITAVMPTAPELNADLDRDERSVLDYAADWKRLLTAELVVALDGPASALHPVRAAGIPILYAPRTLSAAPSRPSRRGAATPPPNPITP
jgi:hypothetical protein